MKKCSWQVYKIAAIVVTNLTMYEWSTMYDDILITVL